MLSKIFVLEHIAFLRFRLIDLAGAEDQKESGDQIISQEFDNLAMMNNGNGGRMYLQI